jgi:hypothetical protein
LTKLFNNIYSFFSKHNEEIISLLIEIGAKVSEAGWMQILGDQFFGTPLALAHWIQNKSNCHPMSEKILKIISKEHQQHCDNVHPKSKWNGTIN